MIKVELHTHTADDPADAIPHSTPQLIDRAAELGYGALAITLHDRQLDVRPHAEYARERGVTLIPGVERTVEGKHVLLLNYSAESMSVVTFDDLRRLREREQGLVVAPHPFFRTSSCLGALLLDHADVFDAVEYNAMFTRVLNLNRRAVEWAKKHGKPMVGNGDVHRLCQLGSTYSLVDADDHHADAICDAIRRGRVRVEARPLSLLTAVRVVADLFATDLSAGRRRRSRTFLPAETTHARSVR